MTLHSNKIVFRGHSDKICDQISDAILSEYLKKDSDIRCDIKVTGTKDKIFITGEIVNNNDIEIDIEKIVKDTLYKIGYRQKFEIVNDITKISNENFNHMQGEVFGYATNETDNFVHLTQVILQEIAIQYDNLVYQYPSYFHPDGNAEIVGYYDDEMHLQKIKTLTINYSNPERHRSWSDASITNWVKLICDKYNIQIEKLILNPNGQYTICGLDESDGVNNNQIANDFYHNFIEINNISINGKDPTCVERFGSYKARQLAIKILKEFNLKWCATQISYDNTGEPIEIFVDSDKGIVEVDNTIYSECSMENVINEFNLKKFNYQNTSKFGHFGLGFVWDK